MKKALFIFTFAIGILGLNAQNSILNSDFELWSYGKPVNWTVDVHGTITTDYINIPVEVHFGEQSTIVHSGNSAVRIASADATSSVISYTMNLPGVLQAGESEGFSLPMEAAMTVLNLMQDSAGIANILSNLSDQDLEALASFFKVFSRGVPCTSTPHGVTAWVKYIPQEGDQMAMFAMTKKDGLLVDYTFELFGSNDPSSYQQVRIDFNTPDAVCDTIMVILVSATQMNSSSVLYVDDVALDYTDGITSYGLFHGNVYPNPASDFVTVRPENDLPYVWTLTDMMGKTLMTGEAAGETTIDTRSCASGMYLLNINGDGISGSRKIMIR
jgi:hypothetical protein